MFENIFLIALSLMIIGVAYARTTFHSSLFLIGAFVCGGITMIQIGASLLGLILLIVYAGAVATFFLFTVMMIGPKEEISDSRTMLSVCKGIVLVGFTYLYYAYFSNIDFVKDASLWGMLPLDKNNEFVSLGLVMYEDFFVAFQGVGVILLVAVIATALVGKKEEKESRQPKIAQQILHKSKIYTFSNNKEKI